METAARMPRAHEQTLLHGAPLDATAGGHPVQFVDVTPLTPNGRVQLFPKDALGGAAIYAYQPDPRTDRFPLDLISPASEHTVSSTLAEFRPGIAKVKMHPEDALSRNIAEGDPIRIFNDLGEVRCEATVSSEMRPGTLALPKGLWAKSTFNGSTANALVPDTLTDLGGGACFSDARVQIELAPRH
jgi:anaerobic selenocysteine-containing dehydrogenase